MSYNFDTIIDRRGRGSFKWTRYPEDVLPLFIADMDFLSPQPIITALHEAVERGDFGYNFNNPALRQTIVERVKTRADWDIQPEQIHFMPNLVSSLNVAVRGFSAPGESVLMNVPIYPPFLGAATGSDRALVTAPMAVSESDSILRYEIDFDALEAAVTPATKVFLFCNPHNPVGRVYTRPELERVAEFCLRHDLIICSDEIHGDLLFDGSLHIPLATLSPEIAARCITLMSPSKTFNLPTLHLGYAIITNEDLMKRFQAAGTGVVPSTGVMGHAAALAAYSPACQSWLDALLLYLAANRDVLVDYVRQYFPGARLTCPEGTYLAWLDWNEVDLPDTPFQFFLDHARVGMQHGGDFGQGYERFTRLNFATPRALLAQALDRMRDALPEKH